MEYAQGLTIVIPVHNRAHIVCRTLASVEAQTLRPLRVVLVDNASTDNSLEILRSWAKAPHGLDVTVVEESRHGATAARNRGLEEVKTEWTMFFDSDDTMRPNHCERALSCSDDADMVGWNVCMHMPYGRTSIKRFYCGDAQFHSLFHGTTATQRYMARTSLFRRAGLWNEKIKYWNDIELGARLLALKPRIRHAGKQISVDVFFQKESITGTSYSMRTKDAEAALKSIEHTLGEEKELWIDTKHAILAADCTREGSPEGRKILDAILLRHNGARRILLKSVYHYRRFGGRGVARLIRPLL